VSEASQNPQPNRSEPPADESEGFLVVPEDDDKDQPRQPPEKPEPPQKILSKPEPNTVSEALHLDVTGLSPAKAVDRLIGFASQLGASDLFLLPNRDVMQVQVRHLGIIRPLTVVPSDMGRKYISHIKAMAGMDVSEHRKPMDGRWIHVKDPNKPETGEDLRISVVPTMYGNDMAIRLMSRVSQLFSIDSLGMENDQLQLVQSLLDSPGGMILNTGPTGSGKTATLYAALRYLNTGTRKINTIEDPIEFDIRGLRQSQVNHQLGLGFANMLRTVLRQGPDVIMIGEIRDTETADTAFRAALSGHLVFSTLHAPVAVGAVQAVRSMGVNQHFLSTALRGIVAQRLVRTLCRKCRLAFDIAHAPAIFDEVRPWLRPGEGNTLFAPKGCDACGFSGYESRTGVFEVLEVDNEIRGLIAEDRPIRQIFNVAIERGMREFRKSALLKVARGLTSTEEVFRVIPSEHLLIDE
jgi:type II secretory ATPase GspE/PulE/Tfp pilus assembly ATPase PilB-like protein